MPFQRLQAEALSLQLAYYHSYRSHEWLTLVHREACFKGNLHWHSATKAVFFSLTRPRPTPPFSNLEETFFQLMRAPLGFSRAPKEVSLGSFDDIC